MKTSTIGGVILAVVLVFAVGGLWFTFTDTGKAWLGVQRMQPAQQYQRQAVVSVEYPGEMERTAPSWPGMKEESIEDMLARIITETAEMRDANQNMIHALEEQKTTTEMIAEALLENNKKLEELHRQAEETHKWWQRQKAAGQGAAAGPITTPGPAESAG